MGMLRSVVSSSEGDYSGTFVIRTIVYEELFSYIVENYLGVVFLDLLFD